jgi:hypothetical protein
VGRVLERHGLRGRSQEVFHQLPVGLESILVFVGHYHAFTSRGAGVRCEDAL